MKTRETTAERVHGPGQQARPEHEANVEHPRDSLSALARAAAGGSEMTPEQLHRLHGLVGNRAVSSLLRTGRLRAVQARLTVGPVDDPYEREADRVASEVLRAPAPAQAAVQRRAASITPLIQRHAGHGAHTHEHEEDEDEPTRIQRKALGAADGSAQAEGDLAGRVAQMSARGAALTEPLRSEMEARFGADFGGVRIHTDAEAARLSRDLGADAFTHGRHIAFGAGRYDPHSSAGKWLLAHELTHTIQQTGADKRPRAAVPLVQRHSTHEHYLLGTLQPDEISSLPSIREEVAKAKANKTTLKEEALLDDDRKDVLHLLEEEMARLIRWQKKSPETQIKEQDKELGHRIGKVPMHKDLIKEEELEKGKAHDYDVAYVRIPTKDNTTVICSYGELNTLADMFGTIEDMSNTEPETIIRMLQGVRQRAYIEIYKIYDEIWNVTDKTKLKNRVKMLRPSTSFEGAVGFSGKEKGGIGAAFAVKGYESVTLDEEDQFTVSNATAALARNACHFAPETWDTWKRYHDQARKLAARAYKRGEDAKPQPGNPFNLSEEEIQKNTEDAQKEQTEAANLALLYSGFGDHYLQDAYASGHLIDKTKVMQWFVKWQKKKDTLKDTPGYAMISAIVEQNLKSNPQMMENVKGGLNEKLENIGVELKEHILVLMWWRRRAHNDGKYKTMTALELFKTEPPPPLRTQDVSSMVTALDALVRLGFVTQTLRKPKPDLYELGQDQIDVLDKDQEKGPYKSQPSGDNLESYKAQAKEFYYVAYAKFLDKAHLQLITNFLHNTFCAQGLTVKTKNGEKIGKIYGDTKMLSAGGQDGIFHSATTALMAREAIYEILETGEAKHSTGDIDARFPRQVAPDWKGVENAKPIAIDLWWTKLEEECTKKEGFFEQGTKRLNIKGMLTKRMVKRLTKDEMIVTPVDELKGKVAPQEKKQDDVINLFDDLLEEPSLEELAQPTDGPFF